MLDKGWRGQDLAKALGVTDSHISLLLSGKRMPSVEVLQKLASLTGLSMDTLAAEAGKKPPKRRPLRINGGEL